VSGRDAERGSDGEEDTSASDRILVACMGNVLRGDDGFGVAVAEALEDRALPSNVEVTEVGISGVSMAQDLLDGYDAMVLVDAMEGGEEPGTLYVERAEVPDLDQYSRREIGRFAADMHQTDPAKVLVLGESLGVLPEPTILVGCEPQATDDLEDALSEPVRAAVPRAVDHIETVIAELRALDGEPPHAEEK
jgi:hydrogenase maturation protease